MGIQKLKIIFNVQAAVWPPFLMAVGRRTALLSTIDPKICYESHDTKMVLSSGGL